MPIPRPRSARRQPRAAWLLIAAWCGGGGLVAAPAWVPPRAAAPAAGPAAAPSRSATGAADVAPPDAPADADATKAAPDTADTTPRRDGRCDRCGCCTGVRRVCVPKPVEREKTKVCWSYRCEELCIPGPSRYLGKTCEHDECGPWWKEWWAPTCARVIRRHVPVKREVTRKVPGVEWTIEERCGRCRHLGPTGDDAPPQPANAEAAPGEPVEPETIATPPAADTR